MTANGLATNRASLWSARLLMNIDISAILTTYQRPKLAERALQSILAQTFVPRQIIVVEDGSKTWFSDWLSDLGRGDIEYFRHDENRGLAAARNTGLHLARHEFVAYLDDDDCWLPTRLEAQVQCWRDLPPDSRDAIAAIQVGCEILDERERHLGSAMPINSGGLRKSIIENGASTPSSCFLFARSALLSVGGFDETLISGIDHDIWMKLAVAGYSSAGIAKPLVVVYKDARHSMMSNTEQRIAGIRQYIHKWTPTYEEWFGAKAGQAYAQRYAIRVIGRLAGEKLVAGRVRECVLASGAVFGRAGREPAMLIYALALLTRSFLVAILQRIRVMAPIFLRRDTRPVQV